MMNLLDSMNTEKTIMINKETDMENLTKHTKMLNLYRNDDRVKEFILKFFNVRTGIRARAFQDKSKKLYYRYGWKGQENLVPLTGAYFFQQIENAKAAIFFYEYLFDDRVTKRDIKKDEIVGHNDKITGATFVFEIDMPRDEDNKKYDFFDHFSKIMVVKRRVEIELKQRKIEYNCVFSGNGIYIIIESLYLKDVNKDVYWLRGLRRSYVKMLNRVTYVTKPIPVVDDRELGWANYFKIPFTFHESRDRMTIPISKGYIDKEWLDKATNLSNDYCMTKENITDIIQKSKWVKIW